MSSKKHTTLRSVSSSTCTLVRFAEQELNGTDNFCLMGLGLVPRLSNLPGEDANPHALGLHVPRLSSEDADPHACHCSKKHSIVYSGTMHSSTSCFPKSDWTILLHLHCHMFHRSGI